MNVVLISTYESGHQPFGLASPAAWLKTEGVLVTCLDLSIQSLAEEPIASADLVAFYIPMHTATKIAINTVEKVKSINPDTHLCFYGLYAPMNESSLRELGADTILGGEFETELVALVKRLDLSQKQSNVNHQVESTISLSKQIFLIPDRSGLPNLNQYAYLNLGNGEQRTVGYTEASRGCKHLCRHCPIVPVYNGKFRIVQRDVVLGDIRNQIQAGARHITFGDPDFLNGPGHAIPIVKALHNDWPELTYDVTIKIEHLLKYVDDLPILRDTGCLFITSAVESANDYILDIFDKQHTKEDFIQVASLLRDIGLTLNPTFVTFTPWTSLKDYFDLLMLILELDLVNNIAPIQYAIRLLIPFGSRLLELPLVQDIVGQFDKTSLCHLWSHPDPLVDQLYEDIRDIVIESQSNNETRQTIFEKVLKQTLVAEGNSEYDKPELQALRYPVTQQATPIPFLSEPWYC